MNYKSLYFFLIAVIFFRSNALSSEIQKQVHVEALTIITIENNLPFSFSLPDGSPSGLYVEFWELWSKTNNIPIQIKMGRFDEGLSLVRNQKTLHAGLFKNKQRQQWADFSIPIHNVKTGVIYHKSINKNSKIRELNGIKISTYHSTYQEAHLKETNPNIEVTTFLDFDDALDQLLENEIQAIIAELPFVLAQLAKNGLSGVFGISDEVVLSNNVYGLIAKGQSELLAKINTGIENIPIEKVIELEKKWLPTLKPFFSTHTPHINLTLEERQWLQNNHDLSIGFDPDLPPFEFIDNNGDFAGLASDYIGFANNLLGINMTPKFGLTWLEAFDALKKGELDIMSAAIVTKERRENMNFTDPYIDMPTAIVVRRGSFYVENMNDINHKILGLVEGDFVKFVQEDYPDIQIQIVNSEVEGLFFLQDGVLDAFIAPIAVANYEIDKQGMKDLVIASFSPYNLKLSMAVRKGLEPLVPILNKAFSSMTTKQKSLLNNTWLRSYVKYGTDLTTIMLWVLPIIFLLILIIIINIFRSRKLKVQVDGRKGNDQRLTTLIQSSPLCIHEIDLNGKIVSMNRAGLNLIDMQNEDDVCGMYYMDFVSEKQKSEINHLLERAYLGEYNAFEFSSEGSDLIFSSCFAPVLNNVDYVERIMGITENVTEQRNHHLQLRESEIKFRNMFENADISIWNEDMSELVNALEKLRSNGVTDLYKYLNEDPHKVNEFAVLIKVLNVNNATLEMFDANSEEEFLAQIPELFGIGANQVFINELCAIWDGEKVFRSEVAFKTYSGKQVNAILSFYIPVLKEGFKSIPVSIVDITLQKQIEEELLKSRKLESVGILAGGIAHDFNNIMTGIFGNLEIAKQKLSPDHSAYQYIKIANQAMNKATNLTNQLLTFAKGGDPLFEIVDVKQIIQDTIEFSLSGSRVKTTLSLEQGLWRVNADKGQFSQVITNLLINANHAMPRGGTLRIEAYNIEEITSNIIPHLSGRYVGINFCDEGVGISEEHQKHIFDPYFTTKQFGSGLGLATSHSIIAKHNGFISVKSELGKGTTFNIYLPAINDTQLISKIEINDNKATNLSSGKILVMDDEEMILNISVEMLTSLGYSVVTVLDGEEAILKYIQANKSAKPFDVVIMDLTIPGGKGGEDVIKKLLKINPDVKSIVSSGYSTDKAMSNYIDFGFKGRLLKPYLMKDLENELNKILSQ